eukprot:CAMPEP_0173271312 /NCGR_PEP_ID=MMETSP1143-20121109/742_1 /TAXON_ID=483371 /ORGANISM="non described non described, Strain CCMP2298" /LENGTH=45 /DNA_ID= /DNA_START= /DNA_END= /DNA_ORIENTATION=
MSTKPTPPAALRGGRAVPQKVLQFLRQQFGIQAGIFKCVSPRNGA